VNRDEFDPSRLVLVRIVWDAILGSPPELQGYGGVQVLVPPTYIPLPDRGTLYTVRGFSRQGADGVWEWVLQGDVSPVDHFVDSLTGRPGWVNQSARETVKTMVTRLYSAGIPADTIASQIPLFVQAIAAEVVAEQQAGVFGLAGGGNHSAESVEDSPTKEE
jgi:hypothetical protein